MSAPITKLKVKDGQVGWMRIQDVEPEIEQNKAFANAGQQTGDFHHIGSIPNVILEKWMQESGVDLFQLPKDEFAKFVRKKLDDPDYRFLRTDGGRKPMFLTKRFGFL